MNGESDQKSARNKSDVKFNFLSEVCSQILCIFNHYRFISIPKKKYHKFKKAQNLENGEFYEKSAQNKKDVEFDFTSNIYIKFPVPSTILLILQK